LPEIGHTGSKPGRNQVETPFLHELSEQKHSGGSMESGQEQQSQMDERPAASTKTVESVVAILLLIFGAVVMWDSWRLGAGWGDDGPKSGYFPFYIGLFIVVGSLINLWYAFKLKGEGGTNDGGAFVLRGQLALVWSVLWPTAVFIVLISYVSGAVFIAWFMRRLGQYSWIKIIPVGIGVNLYFFIMFEVWFKVPLPKGPIEALFGFR
jgi:putative tricarboxylic transport membrane protein